MTHTHRPAPGALSALRGGQRASGRGNLTVTDRARQASTLLRVGPRKPEPKPRPKANVYVDGFNLYYGALKGTPYKWLDLDALFRRLLPSYEIQRIRYFTARVKPRPTDLDAPKRQNAYLRALETLPSVTIHYGGFIVSTTKMPLAEPLPQGPRMAKVIKTEEKGSDVNLATYLIIDAMRADSDAAVVVSNDSDLCEPIRIVNDEIGVPVIIYNPHPKPAAALRNLVAPRAVQTDPSGPAFGEPVPRQGDHRPRANAQQTSRLVGTPTRQKARPRPKDGACTRSTKRAGGSASSNNDDSK